MANLWEQFQGWMAGIDVTPSGDNVAQVTPQQTVEASPNPTANPSNQVAPPQVAPVTFTQEQVDALVAEAVAKAKAETGIPEAVNQAPPVSGGMTSQQTLVSAAPPVQGTQPVQDWTNDRLQNMTPAQINANWDSISAAMSRGT